MSTHDIHTTGDTDLYFRVTRTPTAAEAALGLLLDDPDARFTNAQVRETISGQRVTTSAALASLVREGLVRAESVGRTNLYYVDSSDPVVRQMKITMAVRRTMRALEPVRDRIDLAILFGSSSRGEDRLDSDTDVLVVTSSVDEVLGELSRNLWLQPIVWSPERHIAEVAKRSSFLHEIDRGVRLVERR
jgi:predicted nucleotidyltransferase